MLSKVAKSTVHLGSCRPSACPVAGGTSGRSLPDLPKATSILPLLFLSISSCLLSFLPWQVKGVPVYIVEYEHSGGDKKKLYITGLERTITVRDYSITFCGLLAILLVSVDHTLALSPSQPFTRVVPLLVSRLPPLVVLLHGLLLLERPRRLIFSMSLRCARWILCHLYCAVDSSIEQRSANRAGLLK
jgi:hypothetical protein